MVLTAEKVLIFFRLLEDNNNENYIQIVNFIKSFPALVNLDTIKNNLQLNLTCPPLKIAICKNKFNIAIALLQNKANPNSSYLNANREFARPIFFDLLDNIAQLIELENYSLCEQAFRLISVMDIAYLDYDKEMQHVIFEKYRVNALEYFLNLVGKNYGKKHKLYQVLDEHNQIKFFLGNKQQNLLKEQYYEYIIRHLLLKLDEKLIKRLDAKNYRIYTNESFSIENNGVYIDDFALEICNKYILEYFNYNIINIATYSKHTLPMTYLPICKLVNE